VINTATSTITSESPVSTRHGLCLRERLDGTDTARRGSLESGMTAWQRVGKAQRPQRQTVKMIRAGQGHS
jgi:hypothetical protein